MLFIGKLVIQSGLYLDARCSALDESYLRSLAVKQGAQSNMSSSQNNPDASACSFINSPRTDSEREMLFVKVINHTI